MTDVILVVLGVVVTVGILLGVTALVLHLTGKSYPRNGKQNDEL